MIDATPDFPAQLHALTGGRAPDGIFLTHAHIGHYTGLIYMGKEAMATKSVPVYATARMVAFLRANAPWSALATDGRIELRTVTPDQAVELPGGLHITPMLVPHRDEFSDTVGYLIAGPRAKALFIPDMTSGN
jgi:pyrroloquinoline quinone biosynthesis protein B